MLAADQTPFNAILAQVVRDAVRDGIREAAQADVTINGTLYALRNFQSILTRAEARQYVRRTSDAAFSAWCARWQVRAECRGRWSRARLDLALAREAGTAHVPANLRK